MNSLPFDNQLASELTALARSIGEKRAGLFQAGHRCACDAKGLCVHHAYVNQKLIDAMKALELAGFEAKREQ